MTPRHAHLVRRPPVLTAVLVGVGIALALAAGGAQRWAFDGEPAHTPIPLPIYEVESVSNGYQARLLNLPIRPLGVPQVLTPVDINGDLLPDVTVSVNLVNVEGVFSNPLNINQIVAPNIEINRLATAPILTPGADPLRINVKFTILDAGPSAEDLFVRFGYDTGRGGSIPPSYKALVAGIANLFNPIEAVIDTTGGLLNALDPGIRDLGLTPASSAYEGPLTTFVALDLQSPQATLAHAAGELRFQPMPDRVALSYSSADATQRITAAHSGGDVDLVLDADLVVPGMYVDAHGRISHLPSETVVDINGDADTGGINVAMTPSNAGLPDVSLEAAAQLFGRDLRARLDIEDIPHALGVTWNLAKNTPPSVNFTTGGAGIGAVEAEVTVLTPPEGASRSAMDAAHRATERFLPTEQQFVALIVGEGGITDGPLVAQARLERIRGASFGVAPDGTMTVNAQAGDGARPLQIHADLDIDDILELLEDTSTTTTTTTTLPGEEPEPIIDLPIIEATATIAPLPDNITVDIKIPAVGETSTSPFVLDYHGSSSVDIDATGRVYFDRAAETLPCGTSGVLLCADLALRHVPDAIRATLLTAGTDVDMLIEAPPSPGSAPLDAHITAIAFPPAELDLPPAIAGPMYAEVDVLGLPSGFHLDGKLDDGIRFVAEACTPFVPTETDPGPGECDPDTAAGIAQASVAVRSFAFDARPGDFPVAAAPAANFLTTTMRPPVPGSELLRFEATGVLHDLRRAAFGFSGQAFGAAIDIAAQQPFRLVTDVEGLDLDVFIPPEVPAPGEEPVPPADLFGPISLDADIAIPAIPTPLHLCGAMPGYVPPEPAEGEPPVVIDPIDAELTGPCLKDDMFGDGTEGPGPLALIFDAPSPFDVAANIDLRGDVFLGQLPELPIGFEPFERVAAQLNVDDVPGDITALIGLPQADVFDAEGFQHNSARVLVLAPDASGTHIDLVAAIEGPGASCDDRTPTGSLVCAELEVDGLPEAVSVLADIVTDPDDDNAIADVALQTATCVLKADAEVLTCAEPSVALADVIDLHVRMQAGEVEHRAPLYVPPADEPHGEVLAVVEDLANLAVEAGVRLENLRDVTFELRGSGLDAFIGLGDGKESLTVHGYADLLDAAGLPDAVPSLLAEADLVITPLPATLDLEADWAATGETPLALTLTAEDIDGNQAFVDMHADAEVRFGDRNARCGAVGTICGEVDILDIPASASVTLNRFISGDDDGEHGSRLTEYELLVALGAAIPARADGTDTVSADITLGAPIDLPVLGTPPLRVQAGVAGIPARATIALTTSEQLKNGEVVASSLDRARAYACERDLNANTCIDGLGEIGRIRLRVATFTTRPAGFPVLVSNAEQAILVAGRGLDIEAFGRLSHFAGIDVIPRPDLGGAHVEFAPDAPGNPTDRFDLEVDIEGIPLGDQLSLPTGDATVPFPTTLFDPTADLRASMTLTPFPDTITACFAQPRRVAAPASGQPALLGECLDNPFTMPGSPMSVALNVGESTDLTLSATLGLHGNVDFDDGNGRVPAPPIRVFVDTSLANIPPALTFDLRTPYTHYEKSRTGATPVTTGELHALFTSPGATGDLPHLTLSAGLLVGDEAACEDPRATVVAICLDGGADLPTRVEVRHQPEVLDADNLFIDVAGPAGVAELAFDEFRLTAVIPGLVEGLLGSPLPVAIDTDVLNASIRIGTIPLPLDLDGRLLIPEVGELPTFVLRVVGGSRIPTVGVTVENFIAPDPLADLDDIPTRINHTEAAAEAENRFVAVQRGRHFRLDAELPAFRQVGIEPVVDTHDTATSTDDNQIGTVLATLGFAKHNDLRAYLDLQPSALIANVPVDDLFLDALLDDLPETLRVCVRPPGADAAVGSLSPATWCDSSGAATGEGAIEIRQSHAFLELLTFPHFFVHHRLDVDIFARVKLSEGTLPDELPLNADVLSGRVQVNRIPDIMRVRFPTSATGTVDVGGFNSDEEPDGIDRIRVEAATFDIGNEAAGYLADAELPFDEVIGEVRATPAGPDEEHLHAIVDLAEGSAHFTAQLGALRAGDAARFQHLRIDLGQPCGLPPDPEGNGVPPDLPPTPTGMGDAYTCALVEFDDTDTVPNPLSLSAQLILPPLELGDDGPTLNEGTSLSLRDAELTNVPRWVQIQIAQGVSDVLLDPDEPDGPTRWRNPCRAPEYTASQLPIFTAPPLTDPTCMPALIRIDQPLAAFDEDGEQVATGAFLLGVIEAGDEGGLGTLDELEPRGPAPDFDWSPIVDHYDADDNDREGVLFSGMYDTNGTVFGDSDLDPDDDEETPLADDHFAMRAPFRIPLPNSITLDAPQFFSGEATINRTDEDGDLVLGADGDPVEAETTAFDMRFHFAARDIFGNPMSTDAGDGRLGEAAVFIEEVHSQAQLLLTAACEGAGGIAVDDLTPILGCSVLNSTFAGLNNDYSEGFVIPSELGLSLYTRTQEYTDEWIPGELGDGDADTLRPAGFPDTLPFADEIGRERTSTLIQIDGHSSSDLEIGARLLGDGADLVEEPVDGADVDVRIGDIEVALSGLPAAATGDGPDDPSFRVRTEMIVDSTPHSFIGGILSDVADFILQEREANPLLSFVPVVDVEIGQVSVGLDLEPTDEGAARLVDLVVHADGPKLALNLAASEDMNGDVPVPISFGAVARAPRLDAHVFSEFNLSSLTDDIQAAVGDASDAVEAVGAAAASVRDAVSDWVGDRIRDFVLGLCGLVIDTINAIPLVDITPEQKTAACQSVDDFLGFFSGVFADIADALDLGLGNIRNAVERIINDAVAAGLRAFDAVLNTIPIGARLESALEIEIAGREISRLDFRYNILHGTVKRLEGSEDADLQLGGIDWYIDDLSAGWYLRVPRIAVPGLLRDLGFPRHFEFDPVLLLGLEVRPDTFNPFDNSVDIMFRRCDVLGTLVPFFDSENEHHIAPDADGFHPEGGNFYVWPFAGAGIAVSGILKSPFAEWGDALVNIASVAANPAGAIAGLLVERAALSAILCNAPPLSTADDAGFEIMDRGSSNPDNYNPGNSAAAVAYPGRGVPGQVGVTPPTITTDGGGADIPVIPLQPSATATVNLGAGVFLCGRHTFDSVNINGVVNVATLTDTSIFPSSGEPRCPNGSQGSLEIEAASITMTSAGVINGADRSNHVFGPGLPSDINRLAILGSGGNGGHVGGRGSAYTHSTTTPRPQSAVADVGPTDTRAYTGGAGGTVPGASVTYTETPVESFQSGGRGGAAVVLHSTGNLEVRGTINVDGGNAFVQGVSGAPGVCDTNHNENTANDPPLPAPPVLDDPPFEHIGGWHGAGGGGGGTIVLRAENELDVADATLTAHGGNGGSGEVGVGGGGGGGVIKVLAPTLVGTDDPDFTTNVAGGIRGAHLCPITLATPPLTLSDSILLAGQTVVLATPETRLGPIPGAEAASEEVTTLWHQTAPTVDVDVIGQWNQIVVCAVQFGSGPFDNPIFDVGFLAIPDRPNNASLADRLSEQLDPNTIAAVDDPRTTSVVESPCGRPIARRRIGGLNILVSDPLRVVEVARVPSTGSLSDIDIDTLLPNTEGEWGLFTTAIVIGQAHAEPFSGIERILGVDNADPVVANVAARNPRRQGRLDQTAAFGFIFPSGVPTNEGLPELIDNVLRGSARVTFTTSDFGLSGIESVTCQITGSVPVPVPCVSGSILQLPNVNGLVPIVVSATDAAGNTGSTTLTVAVREELPSVTITLGGNPMLPTLTITEPSGAVLHPETPYIFRFNQGAEIACEGAMVTGRTCTVPVGAITDLEPGEHTIYATMVTPAGRRLVDPSRGTPGPMISETFLYDPLPPLVEATTIPVRTTDIDGSPWYGDAPLAFVSAIDQGPTGVGLREILRFEPDGTFHPFTTFLVEDPTRLTETGLHLFCVRAFDRAGSFDLEAAVPGNLSEFDFETSCQFVQVDDEAPTLTLDVDVAEPASGWYATAPNVTAITAVDQDLATIPFNQRGVGLGEDPIGVIVDDLPIGRCASPCDLLALINTAISGDGEHTVLVAGTDRLDNQSIIERAVRVDHVAPVLNVRIAPQAETGVNGWYTTGATLEALATDAGSGIATLEYSLHGETPHAFDGSEPLDEGLNHICVRATDNVGRVTTYGCGAPTEIVMVDTVAPVVTLTNPGGGWFLSAPVGVTLAASDTTSGLGPVASALPRSACEAAPVPGTFSVGAGICVSIDGGDFAPRDAGPMSIGEGVHNVRAFAVDVAGNRSAMVERIVRVDLSRPVVSVRTVPGTPTQNGWHRSNPLVVLRATDGAQGSGITQFEYQIGSTTGPWIRYVQPFRLPTDAVHVVNWRVSDVGGFRTGSSTVGVDTTPPAVRATTPNRLIWLRLLQPTIDLRYTLADNLSGQLRVGVVIHDATGNVVRRLDGGTITVTPGAQPTNGSVSWNGMGSTLTTLVPLGVYYYRVVVTDEAGNTAHSGESTRLTIRLL